MVYSFLPMTFVPKEGFGQGGLNEAPQVIESYDFCSSRCVNDRATSIPHGWLWGTYPLSI